MQRDKQHAIDNDQGRGIRYARRQTRARRTRRSGAGNGGGVEFSITFYTTPDGQQPMVEWLEHLRQTQPVLEKLVSAGLEKLRDGAATARHLQRKLIRRVASSNCASVARTSLASFSIFGPGERLWSPMAT